MSVDRKRHFVEELKKHYSEIIAGARKAEVQEAEDAEAAQADARNKDDAKGAMVAARLAQAHRQRREQAKREIDTLIRFATSGLKGFRRDAAVGLGALVDVSIESEGDSEERTLFVLPVGAGTELTGPGGDGFVSVVTPASPVGRALQGAAVGDSFEITVSGQEREWSVVDVC